MTVIELAKALNAYIGQGGGMHEVTLFQWDHGSQPLTDLLPREGTDTLELYSNTGWQPPVTEDEFDDLLGLPADDDFYELI